MPLARQTMPPVAVVATPRAKALVMARKSAMALREAERLRQERLMALAFGMTLDLRGVSNVLAGSWLGCGEVRIRDLRSRKAPLSGMHIYRMPEDFRAAFFFALDQVLRAPAANDIDNDPAA